MVGLSATKPVLPSGFSVEEPSYTLIKIKNNISQCVGKVSNLEKETQI